MGVGIRGALENIDPLNKVLFKRATSWVQKDPHEGVSLKLPRNLAEPPATLAQSLYL